MAIFTIGGTYHYRQRQLVCGTSDPPIPFTKLGPCLLDEDRDYGGGIAFRTAVDARQYLRAKGHDPQGDNPLWMVWEMEGSWPQDVAWDDAIGVHRITRDLHLLREVPWP